MKEIEFKNAFELANAFDEIDGWWYIGNTHSERYVLGERGHNPLICFGVNPSTAKPGDDDNTIQIVRRVARENNCDGWIMLNLYPQRSTDPNGLHKVCDKEVYQNNLKVIKSILENLPDAILWAAWGANIDKRGYLYQAIEDIKKIDQNRKWKQRGPQSKKGHPHHPLFVKLETRFEDFDLENYRRNK